jgi:hypothetical protein
MIGYQLAGASMSHVSGNLVAAEPASDLIFSEAERPSLIRVATALL